MPKKNIAVAVILIVLVMAVAVLSYAIVKKKIGNPVSSGNKEFVSFEIKRGESVKEIAADLEKGKLINGDILFRFYLWENKLGGKLKAGTYEVSPSMSIPEIVDLFVAGENGLTSKEARVVIPEGSSSGEILEALKQAGIISGAETINNIQIDVSKFDFLSDRPEGAGLEGYLFPDTYHFFKDASLGETTEKMLENFGSKLTPVLRDDIKKQGKGIYEVLILASIIEKESPDKEDMPIIAGIFYNRMKIDMPLQSDATINYITKKGMAASASEDLAIDSPFNTYKYKGLPPAPICNPGIEAIKAAIYPQQTDYFYFLMPQDGSGKAVFSKTYDEHLQNKIKYLAK